MNTHFNPSTGDTTTTVSIPELKKGNIVIYYGCKFLILEDAECVETEEPVYNSPKPITMRTIPEELRAYVAKTELINKRNLKGKVDPLLWGYDSFQGNSLAKATLLVSTKAKTIS